MKRKIDKNKLANTFFDFTTRESRGGYWIGVIINYLHPFFAWKESLAIVAYIKIILPNFPLKTIIIIVIIANAVIFYALLTARWFIGRYDEKKGIWKRQSEYSAKKEHLSPFNVELRKQLEEHTKALSELTGREIPNHLRKY